MGVRFWYHVMFSTYGAWLRADERGFRDPGHRVHSSGNYRSPPPPHEHAALRHWVKQHMRKAPVRLDPALQREAGILLVGELWAIDADPLVIAVSAEHVHLLALFADEEVRDRVGRIKRRSSHALRRVIPGSLWAKGCDTRRVFDRAHQRTVFRYISEHREEGAWVWTFRDEENKGVPLGHSARRLEDSSSA